MILLELQWLPEERRMTVEDALQSTMEKWNRISILAPLQRSKLEFRLDEELFGRFIREIERQLISEQQVTIFTYSDLIH